MKTLDNFDLPKLAIVNTTLITQPLGKHRPDTLQMVCEHIFAAYFGEFIAFRGAAGQSRKFSIPSTDTVDCADLAERLSRLFGHEVCISVTDVYGVGVYGVFPPGDNEPSMCFVDFHT